MKRELPPTKFDVAMAEFNRARRGTMRSWALLWREEVKKFGDSAIAQMCIRNAIGWRDMMKGGVR